MPAIIQDRRGRGRLTDELLHSCVGCLSMSPQHACTPICEMSYNRGAVTLYDTQTRSQLQTSQKFPTVGSQTKGIEKNADGSYDINSRRKRRPAKRATGCRHSRTRAGFCSCACMGHSNLGLTRLGGRARSQWFHERVGAFAYRTVAARNATACGRRSCRGDFCYWHL